MLKSVIIRSSLVSLRSCRCKYTKSVSNPGVQRRIKLFKDTDPDIDKLQLEENDFEFYEDDFSNASKFYEGYRRESRKLKSIIEFKRIERKYFDGSKNPNLLTWSEKEQIRYLHNSDPAKWTYEELSGSFPATVEIIKKVIKSQWKPKDTDRIKRHDEKVSDNWKAIERGELRLSSAFKEHIKTFVARKESSVVNDVSVEETSLTASLDDNHSPSSSEFLNIIKSYKQRKESGHNYTSSSGTQEEYMGSKPDFPSETYVLEEEEPSKLQHKYYTVDALRAEISAGEKSGKELSSIDEHFLRGSASKPSASIATTRSQIEVSPAANKFGNHKRIETGEVLEFDDIAENIHIPNAKRKPGRLYKVKDCYYNDEGEFLYRVPGLS